MHVLGVIPARGGSKGIPKKNITELAGRPLLAYTVDCAREAETVDAFVVSTDDDDIKEVARDLDAPVVDRPAKLATDEARTEPTLVHASDEHPRDPDAVVTLEPTSPLRTPALVDRCVERFRQTDADAVMTVVPNHSIVGRLEGDRFTPFVEDPPRRRQERETLYEEASTVYVTETAALRETGTVHGRDTVAVEADPREAVDIDDPLDLTIAEAIIDAK